MFGSKQDLDSSDDYQYAVSDSDDGNYTGWFLFVNATGGPITNASVKHYCNDKTQQATAETLANGHASESVALQTFKGSRDTWTVTFTLENGEIRNRDGKQCNLPNANNTTCVLILYADEDGVHNGGLGFSVITADFSPCPWNHY